MAIDRLGATGQLLAALRAEVIRKSERKDNRNNTSEVAESQDVHAKKKPDLAALRRELTQIVKGVPATDSHALDAIRPRVIKAVLLWEFGSELREYRDWQPMLDTLVATLENNPQHRERFSKLVKELQC